MADGRAMPIIQTWAILLNLKERLHQYIATQRTIWKILGYHLASLFANQLLQTRIRQVVLRVMG